MSKKITSALISVFYKDGLEPLVKELHNQGVTIYSTGGTQNFIQNLGIGVVPVEDLTTFPSILGGRVKTLHPSVFGGILGRRANATDLAEMEQFNIPVIDLVIVDLYPFEETLHQTESASFTGSPADAEKMVIEKIDIGGPSMIRAAAKNFQDVTVIASKQDYPVLQRMLEDQRGEISFEQRKEFATKAFEIVKHYDIAISDYFHKNQATSGKTPLRYGENPHQQAFLEGNAATAFEQLHGKELSYNNLVDVDAALQLISEFHTSPDKVFAIIKHTNVCGIASRNSVPASWTDALAGDPESAFGGVLVSNGEIDAATAQAISEIFFEVLIAKSFSAEAMTILTTKKNRILLRMKDVHFALKQQSKTLVMGTITQDADPGNFDKWEEAGGRNTTEEEKQDLGFANLVCKHLKSNAIALVKNKQLIGKGCGQTSRIDALRQALEKAKQFKFDLSGAVMASDAFFPFDDCVKMGKEAGIKAFIQPGGSIRDKDSIEYCKQNGLAMVMTGMRHFRH
jgi:phosphoribosylaminoimidazolecarboxamide formyltransferase / IMP cyclohydrolase